MRLSSSSEIEQSEVAGLWPSNSSLVIDSGSVLSDPESRVSTAFSWSTPPTSMGWAALIFCFAFSPCIDLSFGITLLFVNVTMETVDRTKTENVRSKGESPGLKKQVKAREGTITAAQRREVLEKYNA